MADLAITASQVLKVGTPVVDQRVAASGVTIANGDILYIDGSDEFQLAECDQSAVEAEATHIALTSAAPGQDCLGALLQNGLVVTLGAAAAPASGIGYWLSATAGKHAPEADLIATNYGTFLGVGIGNNQVRYGVVASGVQR